LACLPTLRSRPQIAVSAGPGDSTRPDRDHRLNVDQESGLKRFPVLHPNR
jgi:hypothetical protein